MSSQIKINIASGRYRKLTTDRICLKLNGICHGENESPCNNPCILKVQLISKFKKTIYDY